MKRRAAVVFTALTLLTACAVVPWISAAPEVPCPSSVEEAQAGNFDDDTFVGIGVVMRFVPAPDSEFRGYDLNITRTLTEPAFMDVAFLRIDQQLPGTARNQPVLVVAQRTDDDRVFDVGPCYPLHAIPRSFVDP